MVRRRRLKGVVVGVAAAAMLVAGACGDDDGEEGGGSSDTTETTAAPAGDDGMYGDVTTEAPATGAAVETGDTELGEVLTSGGKTLYIFTADTDGTSTCYEGCEDTWPPLLADAEGEVEVGEGLDAGLFDTSQRDDGTSQVTVDGQPLYFYAPDEEPGDVKGQGVGGVWFAVSPDGTPIEDQSAG